MLSWAKEEMTEQAFGTVGGGGDQEPKKLENK